MNDITTLSARQIAERFGVSERTARRHKARGTMPDPLRSVGQDGKTYPGSYRPSSRETDRTALSGDLVMARNAIRRVARSDTFTDLDAVTLETIVTEAAALLDAWRGVMDGE